MRKTPTNILIITCLHPEADYLKELTIQSLRSTGFTLQTTPTTNISPRNIFTNAQTISGAHAVILIAPTVETAIHVFVSFPPVWKRRAIIVEPQSAPAEFALAVFTHILARLNRELLLVTLSQILGLNLTHQPPIEVIKSGNVITLRGGFGDPPTPYDRCLLVASSNTQAATCYEIGNRKNPIKLRREDLPGIVMINDEAKKPLFTI
jgi:hypothetical protein